MEFPILAMEVRAILRRRLTFLFAFLLYAILAYSMASFVDNYGSGGYSYMSREFAGRSLVRTVVGWSYLALAFHAVLLASGTLANERERRTADLLRVCPIPGISAIVQKLFTPLAIEWLFILGMLPILSIVFLFGGMSLPEFMLGIVSLLVWVNTAALIGMAFSARCATTVKASMWALGTIFFLSFPLFHLHAILEDPLSGFVAVIVLLLVEPFLFLSPIPMMWLSEPQFDPLYIDHFLLGNLVNLFPGCPVAPCWIAHIIFQICLFLFASRWWQRGEGRRVRNKIERSGLFVRVKTELARKGTPRPFTGGPRVFRDCEGRVLFRNGTRPFWLILIGSFLAIGLLGLGMMLPGYDPPEWVTHALPAWYRAIGTTAGVIALLVGVVYAVPALQRERDRSTAILLLSCPSEPSEILNSKYCYYLALTAKALACAWAVPLLAMAVHYWLSPPGSRADEPLKWLLLMLIAVAFVPLAILTVMYGGMRAKKGLTSLFVFSFFLLIIGVQILSIVGRMVASGATVADLIVTLMFYYSLPITLWGGTAYCLARGRRELLKGPRWWESIRAALCIGLLLLVAWDLVVAGFGLEEIEPNRSLPFTNQEFLNVARWLLIPLCTAFLFWYWLATRSRWWWVKHLLRSS